MGDKSRLEMLEQFVKDKPEDAFSRYGLALELKRLGRNDDAVREFSTLAEKNESYSPTYIMFGQLLVALGRIEEAKRIYAKGVTVAEKHGNLHAAGELSEALAQLS